MAGTVAGAGALVARHNTVLLVLRERSGKTRWELPSGLLQSVETFEEAVIREVFEETGLTLIPDELLCTAVLDEPAVAYRGVNVYFLAHTTSRRTPQYQGGAEPIREAAFVDLAILPARALHPVDRRILRAWQRNPKRRNFYLYIRL
jgi:8-oxo-dGTP pyrophosphatase MutT (NUDIX family)